MVGTAAALALPFCANATTYYFKGAENSEMVFNTSGAWTNAQGTAITVTTGATTYQNDDFVVGPKQIVTTYSKRFNDGRSFYCHSLQLRGSSEGNAQFIYRGSAFANCNFVLYPYSVIYLDGRDPVKNGTGLQADTSICVDSSATHETPGMILASTVMTHAQGVALRGKLLGDGALLLRYYNSSSPVKPITFINTSDKGDFTGIMKVQGRSAAWLPLQVNCATGLGGNPASFEPKGLELEYATLKLFSITENALTLPANRGLYIAQNSSIDVDSGITFTVPGAFAFGGSTMTLTKAGAGRLVLSGGLQSGGVGGKISVNAGTLELVAANVANGAVTPVSLNTLTLNGGTAELRVSGDGSALAAGTYTVFSSTAALPAGIVDSVTVDEGAFTVPDGALTAFETSGNSIVLQVVVPKKWYWANGTTAATYYSSASVWTNSAGEPLPQKINGNANYNDTTYRFDDFFVGPGETVMQAGSRDNNARYFTCRSLQLKGSPDGNALFIYRGSAFLGCNFVLYPYGVIWLDGRNPVTGGAGLNPDTTIHVDSSTTYETPGMILASTVMTHAEGVALRGTLKGDGALLFRYYNASSDVKPITFIPDSDNGNFTGIMRVQGVNASTLLPLQVKCATGLGGNPASFESRGLELEYANLKLFGIAENALTLPPNRGLYISRDSTIDVDAGITFTVPGAFAFANTSTALTKSGAGTLSLSKLQDNAVGGRINVAAGKLKLDAATISNGTSTDVLSLDSLSLDQGTVELHVTGDGSALGYGTELTIFRAGSMPSVVKSCVVIDAGAFTYPDDALLSYSIEGDALVMHIEKGYLFTGAVNGNFSETGNWSGGRKPSAGDGTNVVIKVGGAMSVTNDIPGLVLSTIMFKGSAAVTVLGDFAGVASVVNESTAVQTFAGCVTFGDGSAPIEVCTSSDSAYVDFAGGVVGSWPTAHAALHGNYMLTTQEYWTPENAMTLTSGSSLSVSNFNGTALVSIERGATMTVTNALVSSTSDVQWLLYDNHGTFQLLGTLTFDSTVAENGRTKFSKLENCTGTFVINGMDNIGKGSTYFASYRNVSVTHETCYAIGAGGIRATGTSYFLVGNGSWSTVLYPVADWALTSAIYQWNTASTTNMIQFGTTDWRDPSVGRTVTVSNRIASSKIACTAFGIGTLHFAHDGEFLGGFTASDSVVVALDAGCAPGGRAVTMNGTSTLKVAQSGTVTLHGNLTLGADASLGFNFTDKVTAPQLVIPAASTIPTTVNVKISADEGIRPSSNRTYTLTSTFNFTGKTVNVIDKPKWVKSVDAVGGNIVLTAKPTGMILIVK